MCLVCCTCVRMYVCNAQTCSSWRPPCSYCCTVEQSVAVHGTDGLVHRQHSEENGSHSRTHHWNDFSLGMCAAQLLYDAVCLTWKVCRQQCKLVLIPCGCGKVCVSVAVCWALLMHSLDHSSSGLSQAEA